MKLVKNIYMDEKLVHVLYAYKTFSVKLRVLSCMFNKGTFLVSFTLSVVKFTHQIIR